MVGRRFIRLHPAPMKRSICLIALLPVLLTDCRGSRSGQVEAHQKIISYWAHFLKAWDKDKDGRLSRSEVGAIANEWDRRTRQGIPAGQPHPESERGRQALISTFMSEDTNGDGYLTLSELVKESLANFDCVDADHDGHLSESERHSVFARCGPPVQGQPLRPVQ
jgi:Ca2+-binding EF-hand superfamily protein